MNLVMRPIHVTNANVRQISEVRHFRASMSKNHVAINIAKA